MPLGSDPVAVAELVSTEAPKEAESTAGEEVAPVGSRTFRSKEALVFGPEELRPNQPGKPGKGPKGKLIVRTSYKRNAEDPAINWNEGSSGWRNDRFGKKWDQAAGGYVPVLVEDEKYHESVRANRQCVLCVYRLGGAIFDVLRIDCKQASERLCARGV